MIEFDEKALLRMVKLGFSVKTIAEMHECHISTVTNRLNAAGLKAMDGRRNFIEDVFNALNQEEKMWLINEIDYFEDIKDMITVMFRNAHERQLSSD